MESQVRQPGSAHDTYIRRREEDAVLEQVATVRESGITTALLLYGAGGVGKTRLVRALADAADVRDGVIWVQPIDVDDSEYWLLSNLERVVAENLDPDRRFFAPYFAYLSRLPSFTREHVGHETVLSHLGRINETFIECYREFVQENTSTVVITLDTVEALRSMYLLLTLTQWMKTLPRTLFILAGRPSPPGDRPDPIREQLVDPHQTLPVAEVTMSGFERAEALTFLDGTALSPSLGPTERDRLVDLTDGQPLWLALAVDYLEHSDLPPEMTDQHTELARLRTAFRRRLVSPYRSTEFWPEAIKRLAVVRHSVNQDVWRNVMDDRELPPEAPSWDAAWRILLGMPWVRPRANRRYVTLHDAFAEELAQRLIPLHDQNESWRHGLWHQAAEIYRELTTEPDERVRAELSEVAEATRRKDGPAGDAALIVRVSELDARKRELDQLKTAQLHYRVLDDFAAGCDQFVEFYQQAMTGNDPLFLELICHEFERFLPHGPGAAPLEDVLSVVVRRFHTWLLEDEPVRYLEIGLRIARFLTQNEQPGSALELLEALPIASAGPDLRYRLNNERGNACMRIPGRIATAEVFFRQALDETLLFQSPEQERREAEARKEMGFYFRNLGRWGQADEAYLKARNVLSRILGPGSSEADREEMASIQTNWAYLKALQGNYEEAHNLVESAIEVRRRLGRLFGVGISLSVSGEVFRYDRKFISAWGAYAEAETIFQELKSWPWLGQLYQEQAICLFQAEQEGIPLEVRNAQEHAQLLIRQALDICRDQNIRAYPSALNRAGRIFGDQVDLGLSYLDASITEARRVADGWFLSANLIEYLDLSYRAWTDTGHARYREKLNARIADVESAIRDYEFADLRGRWELLQGHLAVHDALDHDRPADLDDAVRHFSSGFVTLADRRVGSHGSAAIASEFRRFRDMFTMLGEQVQRKWYVQLRSDWADPKSKDSATSLLARLEELY